MREDELLREVRRLQTAVFLLLLCFAGALASAAAPKRAHFTEIDVERINIVEPDGRLALSIANTKRLPAARFRGEEFLPPRHAAGLIFFNHEETESGGLIFETATLDDGRKVGYGHLSFDQIDQNQVVKLQYLQNLEGLKSGLSVRPATL